MQRGFEGLGYIPVRIPPYQEIYQVIECLLIGSLSLHTPAAGLTSTP